MEADLLMQCELAFSSDSFCVHAPSLDIAKALKQQLRLMATEALKLGKECTRIYYPGCKQPIEITAQMAMAESGSGGMATNFSDRAEPSIDLLGADYLKLLEHLMEWREEGRIVWIVSNVDDKTLHVNDLLTAPRSLWTPSQWVGYDYKNSWRLGFDDYQQLNPEYYQLKDRLERDGYIPEYDYTLFRTVDSAKVRYQTSYYLCQDYCGIPVRVGVSRPEAWEILQLAPV